MSKPAGRRSRPSSFIHHDTIPTADATTADNTTYNDGGDTHGDAPVETREQILNRIVSFHQFTEESYRRLAQKTSTDKIRAKEIAAKAQEAHLVDGELIFGVENSEEQNFMKRNPDFEEGKTLRDEYGVFPVAYSGKPLEEIDKGIHDMTFVVIAKKFRSMTIFRFSASRALFLLAPWNIVRRVALYIATHQFFDLFIILTILVNCVFLAMPTLTFAETAEYVFLAIYVLEMIVKILARGFILNKYTYLRDPWNWLDFIVIVSAFLTILIQRLDTSVAVGNLQGLRTFRVLRALKTVSIVPGLKTIVNALLRAFKMLIEVIILTCFCLMVFALFALQIYMGSLRQKCVKDIDSYNASATSLNYDQYYAAWIRDSANWQVDDEGDYQLCGNATATGNCNTNYTCLGNVGDNPNYGITCFDHFGWAMLNSLQLITLDFWEDTYNKIIRTSGPWNIFFFLVIVFFGAFYLLNLMLAVVTMSYEEEAISTGKERERDRLAMTKKHKQDVYDVAIMQVKAQHLHQHVTDTVHDQGKKPPSIERSPQPTPSPKPARAKSAKAQKIMVSPAKEVADTDQALMKTSSVDSGYSSRSSGRPVDKAADKPNAPSSGSSADGGPAEKSSHSAQGWKGAVAAAGPRAGVKDGVSVESGKAASDASKEDSLGTISPVPTAVSASGVQLDKKQAEDDKITTRGREEEFVILTAETVEDPEDDLKGKLVDRNCACCRGCCACFVPWLRFENFLYTIVSDPLFDLFITTCIVLNTAFLAIEHHDMSTELQIVLSVGNYVFSSVFILEAVFKILAMNKFYFYNGWNVFDLIIVLASIVDMGVENIKGLSVLRTFRLLRVVKLAQSWATMRMLLTIIISTLGAMSYLTIVLFLIIYIFAVMGLQLFREKYAAFDFGDTEAKRWHFKDFYHSFMMIFRVLCGEWIEALWQCMRAADQLCMAVFLPALIIGNFIVLNLFLALLINAFATDTLDTIKESAKEDNKMGQAFERLKQIFCCCCPSMKKNTVKPTTKVKSSSDDPEPVVNSIVSVEDGGGEGLDKGKADKDGNSAQVAGANGITDGGTGVAKTNGTICMDAFKTSSKRQEFFDFGKARASKGQDYSVDDKVSDKTKDGDGITVVDEVNGEDRVKDADQGQEVKAEEVEGSSASVKKSSEGEENDREKAEDEEKQEEAIPSCFPQWFRKRVSWIEPYNASACGIKWDAFRTFMFRVVENRVFEWIVLITIFASSIALAFEDVYLYQKEDLEIALYILNIIFCVLFSIEMVMKMIAYGLTKYFTTFWTILDFAIVVISVASLIGESLGVTNIAAFRSLRTLRALRPLRAISRWEGMKIVVNSLMRAIPAIFNVLLVGMMFWLIFSIMGVQFFSGRFYKCVNITTGDMLDASSFPNRTFCLSSGQRWLNSKINFDNAAIGFLALFQVATFEGWMEVMQDAVDVTDVDQQPEFEANLVAYLYFVIFIVFGAFFILNLFISVIIDNFNMLKKKYEGSYLDAFLTESQRNYYNTMKKLANKKPQKTIKPPKNGFLKFFYNISMSTKFELAVVLLISLNMIVMAVEHYNQPNSITQALEILNIVFTSIFVLEAIIKLLGLRYHYFRVPWNVFDFLIVILSLIDIILDDILNSVVIKPTLLRVVRVFRIGRVLRLIKAAKGIRKLLFALIISLPAIFNIGALLLLVMYIYAIIGMSSFSDVKLNGVLNDLTNFQTFANSFLLLFRLATSAGWNDVLDALLIQEPDCNGTYKTLPDGNVEKSSYGDCGVPWLAIPFMMSYIIVVYLIVINMYIAVILENFNQAHQQEEVGITEDDFEMFYVVWERYDPHATQFIKYDQLSDFVADLDEPLQLPKPNEITIVSFNLSIMEGDKVHCLDILMALVTKFLNSPEESEELNKLKDQMHSKFNEIFPSRQKLAVKSTTLQRKKEDVAARTLQRAWRSHRANKAMREITDLAFRRYSMSRNSSIQNSPQTSGVFALSHRISNALSSFFGSSRANSVTSLNAPQGSGSPGTRLQPISKQSNLSNTLQVPQVDALYGHKDSSVSSEVEL